MPVEIPSAPAALPVRTCGTCTLCCRLPDIDALAKPANTWCIHCTAGKGCTIYSERPQLCRDFLCLWMKSDSLGPEWEPAKAKMMVYTQGPQITVLVDPAFPQVWRNEPYASAMRRWAADAETTGGYVIVFVGEDVVKIDAGKTLAG
ncbi:YkgJ family cysteine cluster protein [Agrobacterium vitis]